MSLSAFIWCFGNAFELLNSAVLERTFWVRVQYFGIAGLPTFWLLFVLTYTRQDKAVLNSKKLWFAIVPLLTVIFAWSNDFHHLLWSEVIWVDSLPYDFFLYTHGLWFWFLVIYNYMIMTSGLVIMIRAAFYYPQAYRKQLIALIAGMVFPWLGNVAYLVWTGSVCGFDPTPFALTVSAAILFYAINRQKLLDLVPIAREILIENMEDGMIVLDRQNRIIEINLTGSIMTGLSADEIIGKNLRDVLPSWEDQVNLTHTGSQEFSFTRFEKDQKQKITFWVTISPLGKTAQKSVGKLITLSDISYHKQLEEALLSSTEQLTLIIDGIPLMLAYIDAENHYIYVNRSYLEWYGVSREEIKGKLVSDIVPEQNYNTSIPYIQRVLHGEHATFEESMTIHGKTTNNLVHYVPHFNNQGIVQAYFVLTQDISDLKRIEQAERDQRNLAETLRQTISALAHTHNFDEICKLILEYVGRVVPSDAANITTLDAKQIGYVRYARGYDKFGGQGSMLAISFPVENIPTWNKLLKTRQPIIIPDTNKDPDWLPVPETLWIQSHICTPILINNEVFGFINLDDSHPGFFKPEQVQQLHAFADEVAVSMQNANLFAETVRRAEQLATLNRIALAVTRGLDLNVILHTLYEQCLLLAHIDLLYLAFYDEATAMFEIPLFYEKGSYNEEKIRFEAENSLTLSVVNSRKPLLVGDFLKEELTLNVQIRDLGHMDTPVRSYLGIPLISREKVIGVMSMQNFEVRAFNAEHVRLFETVASQATIAIENARLYSQMEYLAMTDSLTQLYNHRQFIQLATAEFERSIRYRTRLALIMVDIDRFKNVNDNYGHAIGDEVLRQLGQLINSAIRSMDIAGRVGGEEFMILMPHTSMKSALQAAERLRSLVADHPFQTLKGSLPITASFGVSKLIPASDSLQIFLDRADQAMYKAKENGRNQVQFL